MAASAKPSQHFINHLALRPMDEPVLDRATAMVFQLLKTPAHSRVSSLNACFGEGWWWGRGGAVGRMGRGRCCMQMQRKQYLHAHF